MAHIINRLPAWLLFAPFIGVVVTILKTNRG